jgi:hypothetical protein
MSDGRVKLGTTAPCDRTGVGLFMLLLPSGKKPISGSSGRQVYYTQAARGSSTVSYEFAVKIAISWN